jgi:hypothetical protein
MKPFTNYILELSQANDNSFDQIKFASNISLSRDKCEITPDEFDTLAMELIYVCNQLDIYTPALTMWITFPKMT